MNQVSKQQQQQSQQRPLTMTTSLVVSQPPPPPQHPQHPQPFPNHPNIYIHKLTNHLACINQTTDEPIPGTNTECPMEAGLGTCTAETVCVHGYACRIDAKDPSKSFCPSILPLPTETLALHLQLKGATDDDVVTYGSANLAAIDALVAADKAVVDCATINEITSYQLNRALYQSIPLAAHVSKPNLVNGPRPLKPGWIYGNKKIQADHLMSQLPHQSNPLQILVVLISVSSTIGALDCHHHMRIDHWRNITARRNNPNVISCAVGVQIVNWTGTKWTLLGSGCKKG